MLVSNDVTADASLAVPLWKVTDAQMRELRITPNSAMPKWN